MYGWCDQLKLIFKKKIMHGILNRVGKIQQMSKDGFLRSLSFNAHLNAASVLN